MNLITAASKGLSAIGSVGGMAADIIEGTTEIGSKAKKALHNEINSLQVERDMENATARILERAKYVKQIAGALGIDITEATKMLYSEIDAGKYTAPPETEE